MISIASLRFAFIAPAGFARESGFWQAMFWSGIFGVIMGFVVLGFNNVGDEIPKEWVDNKGFDSAEDAEFYKGTFVW